MACRGPATLLLAAVALGLGGSPARAATGTLSPNPPTTLPSGPSRPVRTSPARTTPAPAPTSPPRAPAGPAGALPRTGIDLPLELSAGVVLLAGGLAAGALARARRE